MLYGASPRGNSSVNSRLFCIPAAIFLRSSTDRFVFIGKPDRNANVQNRAILQRRLRETQQHCARFALVEFFEKVLPIEFATPAFLTHLDA
jgi:hypothetical protein